MYTSSIVNSNSSGKSETKSGPSRTLFAIVNSHHSPLDRPRKETTSVFSSYYSCLLFLFIHLYNTTSDIHTRNTPQRTNRLHKVPLTRDSTDRFPDPTRPTIPHGLCTSVLVSTPPYRPSCSLVPYLSYLLKTYSTSRSHAAPIGPSSARRTGRNARRSADLCAKWSWWLAVAEIESVA